jgi:hypothetical protein
VQALQHEVQQLQRQLLLSEERLRLAQNDCERLQLEAAAPLYLDSDISSIGGAPTVKQKAMSGTQIAALSGLEESHSRREGETAPLQGDEVALVMVREMLGHVRTASHDNCEAAPVELRRPSPGGDGGAVSCPLLC